MYYRMIWIHFHNIHLIEKYLFLEVCVHISFKSDQVQGMEEEVGSVLELDDSLTSSDWKEVEEL